MTVPPEDLAAVEARLLAREAACADLRPDSAARIVWSDGPRRQPLALVYLHGFSASPLEISPFCEELAAALGANLLLARLTGHGQAAADALDVGDEGIWCEDARQALALGRRLGDAVILIGTSTGAALATLMAAEGPAAETGVAALVLIAPNFALRDRRSVLLGWPGARCWIHHVIGRERVLEAANALHAARWSLRYPARALVPMYRLSRRARRLARPPAQPTLAILSDDDEVVDSRRGRAVLSHWNDVEILAVDGRGDSSRHVVVGAAFGSEDTGPALRRTLAFLADRGLVPAAASAAGDRDRRQ